MADISKVTLPDGNSYDIKDTTARNTASGKSTVSVSQIVSSGENIADITIDGNTTHIYAPSGGDYILIYDPLSSVGYAEIGEAVTGTPNYTPAGTITYTKKNVNVKGSGSLKYYISSGHLVIEGVNVNISSIPMPDQFTFNGTGVSFAIQEEEE